MFEVSVLESRTPPDKLAFFVIILLNGLQQTEELNFYTELDLKK